MRFPECFEVYDFITSYQEKHGETKINSSIKNVDMTKVNKMINDWSKKHYGYSGNYFFTLAIDGIAALFKKREKIALEALILLSIWNEQITQSAYNSSTINNMAIEILNLSFNKLKI